MLDPMTRALLLTPTLLADTGGARLGATAARRAVRLQKRAHQRPEGEGDGQGCVCPWFGEGFLYIGYATLRRGGVQNELVGPAYRWQEHLVNHARGGTAEADKLRYRMAKRKALGELQHKILQVADEPESRLMESTAVSTISPNAYGRRAKTRNADPRARARRRRPRFRERTVVPCFTRGKWDQKKQRERAKRSTVRSESEATTKLLLPSQAPPLRTVPWTTWERAWWWKRGFSELYRMIQKIDRRAKAMQIENRSAWPMLLMWLATKEARGQKQWEEIEEVWRREGSDDPLLERTAAVPLLDTPYRRTMARRQLDQELKRRGLPETRGITVRIRTASAVKAAKKAAERVVDESVLTDGEKRWCKRQIRIVRGPKDTFLSSSRARSQARTAKVKELSEMSGRKLQEHIRLSGARLVQQRWDVEVRKC